MGVQSEARRREATKAFLRYFVLGLVIVACITAFTVYAFIDAHHQRAETRAIRIAYCTELEKLKTQNREDVKLAKKNFKRDLKLLHLKDTPALHKAAEEGWARKLRRNAPKECPYTADTEVQK